MNRNFRSFFFLLGVTSICLVWLSMSLLSTGDGHSSGSGKTGRENNNQQPSGFLYSEPGRAARFIEVDAGGGYDLHKVQRQLERRSHMEKSGMVKNIIDNDEMPEEIRRRFRAEKERLDQLASQYPEMAAKEDRIPLPRQVDDNGELDSKFKEAIAVMKKSGDWDKLHQDYLHQLEAAAANEYLPPEERPSQEDIEAFKAGGFIPAL